jgi:DNA-binding protein YbaB
MYSPEESLTRRLATLELNGLGDYYRRDATGSGSDPTGSVTVTVDPTDRVVLVRVNGEAATVRTPELLDAAVLQAHVAAQLARRDAVRPRPERTGARPLATGAGNRPVRALDNLWAQGRTTSDRTLPAHPRRSRDLGPATGTSDNDCVTVTLGIASSQGRVAADPGWLVNATSESIGNAITQAFAAAYRRRDEA